MKNKNGFTSIGMAFVMIMAAALFPAVNGAVHSAKSTALKNKGRGIWVAVVTANTEREILDLPPLWAGDLQKDGKKFDTAEAYFTYLMSDGDTDKIQRRPENRLVEDLKPEMLSGPGMTPPAQIRDKLPPEANAWHVVCLSEDSPADMPFLISRNVKISDIRYATQAELRNPDDPATRLSLNPDIKPFGAERVVWVTRGGSTCEARARLATRARLCPLTRPEGAPELNVLPAKDGHQ